MDQSLDEIADVRNKKVLNKGNKRQFDSYKGQQRSYDNRDRSYRGDRNRDEDGDLRMDAPRRTRHHDDRPRHRDDRHRNHHNDRSYYNNDRSSRTNEEYPSRYNDNRSNNRYNHRSQYQDDRRNQGRIKLTTAHYKRGFLELSNVPFDVMQKELVELYLDNGNLKGYLDSAISFGNDDRSLGLAYVSFMSQEEAESALEHITNHSNAISARTVSSQAIPSSVKHVLFNKKENSSWR